MNTLLAIVLLTAFPSTNRVSWMRLEAFHLAIGMTRAEAAGSLDKWAPKQGRDANEIVVDYDTDKSLTLEFRKNRLRSVRFELFVFLPEVRAMFEQEKAWLADTYGAPPKTTRSVLIYDNTLPNVMAVVDDDPRSEHGKRGLGVLAVRYYDPR